MGNGESTQAGTTPAAVNVNIVPDRVISRAELAAHKDITLGIWIALAGKVFDVTSFINRHPGGKSVILQYAGRDATSAFHSSHPYVNPHKYASCLGVLSAS